MEHLHRPAYLYFIQAGDDPAVKIGTTTEPLEKRLLSLQTANHKQLRLIGAIDLRKIGGPGQLDKAALARVAKKKEAEIEAMFSKERIHGKWFKLTGELSAFIRKNSNMGAL